MFMLYTFFLFLWCVTSTNEIALTGSVKHGYDTDVYPHNIWNHVCVQMTQGEHFIIVAQWKLCPPLKMLIYMGFIEMK